MLFVYFLLELFLAPKIYITAAESESGRNQEEGGELDSHKEVSPEEIKSREAVLGLRVGLLLLQLLPSGGATNIVFVTVLHSIWDSNSLVRRSLRNAGRTLP